MTKSSLRRAFAMLRLVILAAIASLGAFAMPSSFKFVPSALAVTPTEKPLRANASKSQHAVPGDDDEATPSSEVDDEDDDSSDEDCDDDDEDD